MSSEIRQNMATREWVIFAPSRKGRPHDPGEQRNRVRELPTVDPACPFCPGNESMLPAVIMEIPGSPGADRWQVRVVPNKFAAVTPDGSTERRRRGLYVTMPGYGRHEVVIESPYHNQDLSQMPFEHVSSVLETYHRRYIDLMQQHENMMAIVFRNHGARAGTSLIHPHSQIIVTGMVPQHIRSRESEAQRYFDEWGRCVYCDILEFELKEAKRIVLQNSSFAAFVPFAADVPFEVWIMPRKHSADFGTITDGEKSDLALALREILANLYVKLGDPDYNFIINSSARYKADAPLLHWYLQIRPRLTTQAGFEIGSGISINPSLPEDDAQYLRSSLS